MRERLSTTFWRLATGSGVNADSREPLDVVRHLLAALDGLEGHRPGTQVATDALQFLLRLEHDPRYASPEQTRGGENDSRALVYSVGVLLFERLTGHHPFIESLSPIGREVSREMALRRGPNNLCSLPGALRDVLRIAMSPFPEDRYESVRELRSALERVVLTPRLAKGTNPPRSMTELDPRIAPLPGGKRIDTARADTLLAPRRPSTQSAPDVAPARMPSAPRPPTVTRVSAHPRTMRRPGTQLVAPSPSRVGTATDSFDIDVELDLDPHRTVTLPAAPAPRRRSAPPPCPGSDARAAFEASNPRIHTVTSIFDTPAPPPPAAHLAAGSAPSRMPIETSEELVSSALASLSRANPQRFLKPAIVAAAVATVSLVATLAVMSLRSDDDATTTTAAPDTAPVAVPVERSPEPEPEPVTAPIAIPVPATEVPVEFSPDVVADTVLAHTRDCIADRLPHSEELGMSLRFLADTGAVDKVYFAPNLDLTTPERTCIRDHLAGLTAGAAPERSTVVSYTLWVTRDGGTARAHHVKVDE